MTIRTSTSDASRRAQTSISRCTIREFDDDHDMMEIKQADVMHSETPTNFERWQQAGTSVHPMPQDKDMQQQPQQQQNGGGDSPDMSQGWNNNQPKGPASEGIMLYVGGSRSHPVCVAIDDRRVRPYQTKPGECLYYAADGSGQTIYHRVRGDGADGLYILTLDDGQSSGHGVNGLEGKGAQKRFVSIRHVNKQKQKRKSKKLQKQQAAGGLVAGASNGGGTGDQQQNYKHEGDSVNTEVQLTSGKINFNDGGGNKGFYDNGKKDWMHHDGQGAPHSSRCDKTHTHIKHDGAHVWVADANFKSMPFVIRADPCT